MNPKETLGGLVQSLQSSAEIADLTYFPIIEKTVGGKLFYISACKATYNGLKCVGMAASEDKDKAAYIAVMELVERIFMQHNSRLMQENPILTNLGSGLKERAKSLSLLTVGSENWFGRSSNGVAIHTDVELAESNALDEVIERHTVLKALALNASPQRITNFDTEFAVGGDFAVDAFHWRAAAGRVVVIIRAKKGCRTVYAFGSGTVLKDVVGKAVREFALKMSVAQSEIPDGLKFTFGNENSMYHWENETPVTDALFEDSSEEGAKIDDQLSLDGFWHVKMVSPPFLSHLPQLKVVKVVSPKIQQLFFGDWSTQNMNRCAIGADLLPREKHIIG